MAKKKKEITPEMDLRRKDLKNIRTQATLSDVKAWSDAASSNTKDAILFTTNSRQFLLQRGFYVPVCSSGIRSFSTQETKALLQYKKGQQRVGDDFGDPSVTCLCHVVDGPLNCKVIDIDLCEIDKLDPPTRNTRIDLVPLGELASVVKGSIESDGSLIDDLINEPADFFAPHKIVMVPDVKISVWPTKEITTSRKLRAKLEDWSENVAAALKLHILEGAATCNVIIIENL